jgi:hypothetical protein
VPVESKEMSLFRVDAKRLVGVQLVKSKLERRLMKAATIGLIGCAGLP